MMSAGHSAENNESEEQRVVSHLLGEADGEGQDGIEVKLSGHCVRRLGGCVSLHRYRLIE
jgi:hypothetical protein